MYINCLQSNQTLKTLNMAYNGLANEGAVAIADALKLNSTLEELDIRCVCGGECYEMCS